MDRQSVEHSQLHIRLIWSKELQQTLQIRIMIFGNESCNNPYAITERKECPQSQWYISINYTKWMNESKWMNEMCKPEKKGSPPKPSVEWKKEWKKVTHRVRESCVCGEKTCKFKSKWFLIVVYEKSLRPYREHLLSLAYFVVQWKHTEFDTGCS